MVSRLWFRLDFSPVYSPALFIMGDNAIGKAALGRLAGLVRRLETTLYPQEKLEIVDQLHRWSLHHHAEHHHHHHHHHTEGRATEREKETDRDEIEDDHGRHREALMRRRNRVVLQLADHDLHRMQLEKEIETEERVVAKCEARRVKVTARIHSDQSRVHELLEAAKTTDMEARLAITMSLRAVRKDLYASKKELSSVNAEASKLHDHVQTLYLERQHAADEHEQHMAMIQTIDAKLEEVEHHHHTNVKTQDYLKRRSHVLRKQKAEALQKREEIQARRRQANSKHFDADQAMFAAARPKPPMSSPGSRQKRAPQSPRQKKVEASLNRLRNSLTEYRASSPLPNTFGRTMRKMWRRQKSVPRQASLEQAPVPTKILALVEGGATAADTRPATPTPPPRPPPSSTSAAPGYLFHMGDLVWVQYEDAFHVLHERYPAIVDYVHRAPNGSVSMYDIVNEADSSLETAIAPARLFPREQGKGVNRSHNTHSSTQDEVPSSPSPSKDKDDNTSTLDEHLIQANHLNERFKIASQHLEWGMDFRKNWDAAAKKRRASSLEKSKNQNLFKGKGHVAGAAPTYSFLDNVFAGPPNGAEKRFYVVPPAHPLSMKCPPMEKTSKTNKAARAIKIAEEEVEDAQPAPKDSEQPPMDGKKPPPVTAAEATKKERSHKVKGLNNSHHRTDGQNKLGFSVASFMQNTQASTREVGGVPLRMDYHSAKFARKQRSPNRGVLANLIGRARHRNPPLHSSMPHNY